MDWSVVPFTVLRLALLLAGLLVPGSMLLRALRLPWALAAAFVSSCAALYVSVLVFSLTGVPISLATLSGALALVALAGHWATGRRRVPEGSSSFAAFAQLGWWLPLYLAFWAVVGYRLIAEPLSGPDVNFRWSWLGEQMVHLGSINFYPPHRAEDFISYFWAESIPPGVASLYAWAYACAGDTGALWTSPIVALQLLALHELIWRVANRWGGEVAARRAVLLAAACPLLTWAVLIGQETGLTALAVCGLVWCLQKCRTDDGPRWAALAGVFAIVAASTREYGPVFAIAATGAAWGMRLPRRTTLTLASVALPVALVWPARVWWLTGNPLFSLDVGGIFPTNPVFTAWNDTFRAPHAAIDLRSLARYLLLWALPACAGLVALGVLLSQRLREVRLVAALVLLVGSLWLASVAYTAGGLFYSLRVLSPVFALLVVVAGYSCQLLVRSRRATVTAAMVLTLVSLEALPKTLVLPENPYTVPPRGWLQVATQFPTSVRASQEELLAKLKPLPGRRRILTDNAGLPRELAEIGTEALPLWSPEFSWLFEPECPPVEVARRWGRSGLRYIIISRSGPTADFIRTHARWRAPYFTLKTVAETETQVILQATSMIDR
jgi:hypothetical protein